MISTKQIMIELKRLQENQTIRAIDFQLAKLLQQLKAKPTTSLIAVLINLKLSQGHICLPIYHIRQTRLFSKSDVLHHIIKSTDWISILSTCHCISINGQSPTPLVLDNGNIYIYRYWELENKVSYWFKKKPCQTINLDALRSSLTDLFKRDYLALFNKIKNKSLDQWQSILIQFLDIVDTKAIQWQKILECISNTKQSDDLKKLDELIPLSHCLNWQKIAIVQACINPFSLIIGGPGTGKTTTVAKLLTILLQQEIQQDHHDLAIELVAPTGKAAARLSESINLVISQLKTNISFEIQAKTVHRLLGFDRQNYQFKYNKDNPLNLDILIIDETSMIDLSMMAALLSAIPKTCHLIILGDKDQLSSVEAGSVLADLCLAGNQGYSTNIQKKICQLTGYKNIPFNSNLSDNYIGNHICLLKKSYRFDHSSGIGQLAKAVNESDTQACQQILHTNFNDLTIHFNKPNLSQIIQLSVDQYSCYLDAIHAQKKPLTVLNLFNQFRLLCAIKEGKYGIYYLNQAIEKILFKQKKIQLSNQWYIGKPIMIQENDYQLELFNGDIGICMPDKNDHIKVFFQINNQLKSFSPMRLNHFETTYAMTIHKSQGSEFNHTAIIIPDTMSPLLTKELLYTGVTRAKKKLDLYTDPEILIKMVNTKTERFSGLQAKLVSD